MDFNVYKDIEKRTNGEIYIGVVGPVRTGKSTFIKNFMDIAVVPNIKDENEVRRTMDELPQSSAGKTIMTTEPKFIPNKAVNIKLGEKANLKVREWYIIIKPRGFYHSLFILFHVTCSSINHKTHAVN